MRPLSIGNDALAVLMRYGWPGNVRQLAGVLFRAALQCDGNSLTAEHFPHIAIQSRFSGRRSDFTPNIGKLVERRGDGRRAGRHASTPATAICARSRKSRPTSSASPSAITAAA